MISAFGVDHGISKSLHIKGVGRVRFRSKGLRAKGAKEPAFHQTQARLRNGREVGSMRIGGTGGFGKPGEIQALKTHKLFQREGIATGMVRHAENTGKKVFHSTELSAQGEAFARKVPTKAGGVHKAFRKLAPKLLKADKAFQDGRARVQGSGGWPAENYVQWRHQQGQGIPRLPAAWRKDAHKNRLMDKEGAKAMVEAAGNMNRHERRMGRRLP